jgi:hypothetical protein
MITPPQINKTRRCSSSMRRSVSATGAVLDAVDGRIGVADVELRQHNLVRDRHRRPIDARSAHQTAVGRGLIGTRLLCRSQQAADVAKAAQRIESTVELAVLIIRHAEPHPGAERDHQYDHRKRCDDDDHAQGQHRRHQPV